MDDEPDGGPVPGPASGWYRIRSPSCARNEDDLDQDQEELWARFERLLRRERVATGLTGTAVAEMPIGPILERWGVAAHDLASAGLAVPADEVPARIGVIRLHLGLADWHLVSILRQACHGSNRTIDGLLARTGLTPTERVRSFRHGTGRSA